MSRIADSRTGIAAENAESVVEAEKQKTLSERKPVTRKQWKVAPRY